MCWVAPPHAKRFRTLRALACGTTPRHVWSYRSSCLWQGTMNRYSACEHTCDFCLTLVTFVSRSAKFEHPSNSWVRMHVQLCWIHDHFSQTEGIRKDHITINKNVKQYQVVLWRHWYRHRTANRSSVIYSVSVSSITYHHSLEPLESLVSLVSSLLLQAKMTLFVGPMLPAVVTRHKVTSHKPQLSQINNDSKCELPMFSVQRPATARSSTLTSHSL